MELRKIDLNNVWKIVHLSATDEQKAQDFVASNAESIIEAYAAIQSGYTALPFGLYEDAVPVGFVMLGYGSIGDEEEPAIVNDSYCIWRFMIDKNYQGRGYGKTAMEKVLSYLRTFPCGQASWCWLSYEPENTAARALYAQFGFRETGERDGDEVVAVLKL
ncbi:MAG: GNAT family N-acetyltransferase [Clostridia bacterium]|nr:GNAT family N-acetyltransferase [Clostridia bacterium]